jgi:hypothetical protein
MTKDKAAQDTPPPANAGSTPNDAASVVDTSVALGELITVLRDIKDELKSNTKVLRDFKDELEKVLRGLPGQRQAVTPNEAAVRAAERFRDIQASSRPRPAPKP